MDEKNVEENIGGCLQLDDDDVQIQSNDETFSNETTRVDLDKYPPSIKYIMGNEVCERFSYYGLKAILELYFTENLHFSDNKATTIVHLFVFFAYFFTLPGGLLADVLLGRYKTILSITLVYCIGTITLAVSSIPSLVWGTYLGLFIVAMGTGGIKACVSAFIGDQFVPGQELLVEKVFGIFYFCVNAGALLSTVITPLLRAYVHIFIAFALPAFLLFIAIVIFWLGRRTYTMVPPSGSSVLLVYTVLRDSIIGTFKNLFRGQLPSNFYQPAEITHTKSQVDDIRKTLKVLSVFCILPLFSSLFDQNGTRWVLQADLMNRSVYFFDLTADQIPTLNPLFTVLLVPVFNNVVYPFFRRIGKPLRPIRKISLGLYAIVVSFVFCAALQYLIDQSPPQSIHVICMLPQFFMLSVSEILVQITCLEFSYTEAPKSMKSTVMAVFLCTIAFGNLLVASIASIDWPKELFWNFVFYSVLMLLGAIAFSILFRNYRYSPLVALTNESDNNNINNGEDIKDEDQDIELEDIIQQVD